MAKGYWIAYLDVRDPEGYKAYMAAAPAAHARFETRLLARAGQCERVEGQLRSRYVLREFNSQVEALACYDSPEYVRARPLRMPHASADFLIVEGWDGAQPTRAAPANRPKGYWLAHIDAADRATFDAHVAAAAAPIGRHGGHFLVRDGRQRLAEGHLRTHCLVVEFPSYGAALDCYRSGEYRQAIGAMRERVQADFLIAEGQG